MNQRQELRLRRHRRVRRKVFGTPQRPRLAIFRSLAHIYAQLIDDTAGQTLAAASTLDKEIKAAGKSVVKRCYHRDELFAGACIDSAPDLCVQSIYGYDLKGAVNKTQLMDREVFTGMHTQDDATLFINSPSNTLRNGKPHITDIAPSVLSAMGIEVPAGMDGRSLLSP